MVTKTTAIGSSDASASDGRASASPTPARAARESQVTRAGPSRSIARARGRSWRRLPRRVTQRGQGSSAHPGLPHGGSNRYARPTGLLRLNDILDRVAGYHPDPDLDIIKKAYVYSAKVHQGQLRKSGEPYLVHPLEVAGILAELKLDEASIVTGLLHDTIEDTLATQEELTELFGPEVAELVDGVTKLSQVLSRRELTQEEKQAENFRKMVVAMAKDIRVILVKLADRTHNMRTLEHMKPEKQERIAQETLDIYAPLANRLGIQLDQERAGGPLLPLPASRRSTPTLPEKRRRRAQEGAREVHRGRRATLIRTQARRSAGLEGAASPGRLKHVY